MCRERQNEKLLLRAPRENADSAAGLGERRTQTRFFACARARQYRSQQFFSTFAHTHPTPTLATDRHSPAFTTRRRTSSTRRRRRSQRRIGITAFCFCAARAILHEKYGYSCVLFIFNGFCRSTLRLQSILMVDMRTAMRPLSLSSSTTTVVRAEHMK